MAFGLKGSKEFGLKRFRFSGLRGFRASGFSALWCVCVCVCVFFEGGVQGFRASGSASYLYGLKFQGFLRFPWLSRFGAVGFWSCRALFSAVGLRRCRVLGDFQAWGITALRDVGFQGLAFRVLRLQ